LRYHARLIMKTELNDKTDWVDLVNTTFGDCIGVVMFKFGLDPDPNCEYKLTIGKLIEDQVFQSSSIVSIDYPFIFYVRGYDVFQPNSPIKLSVRNLSSGITTKTSYIFAWIEVWR